MPWRELLAKIPGTSDIANIRRAHLLTNGTPVEMALAADALQDPELPAPARGIRMLLMVQMMQYDALISMDYHRRGLSALDQEEAVHAYASLSVAHASLGHRRDAHADARIALEHANALNMVDRAHHLSILSGRHNRAAGRPDPEASAARLRYPMQRPRWGLGIRSYAEDWMALGDYQTALSVLGPPDADDNLTAGLRAMLHVFLGLPNLRPYDPEDRRYGTVAAGLERYFAGSNEVGLLLEVGHEPQASYGRLVAAAMKARDLNSPYTDVQRILGREEPYPADQAALWHLIYWQASPRLEEQLMRHVMQTASALLSCRNVYDLLNFVKRVSPDTFLLLRSAPFKWPGKMPGIEDIPVLYGRKLLYRASEYTMPGRIGRVLVNRRLGVPDDELDRKDYARMRETLTEAGIPAERLANWGQVVHDLNDIAIAAAGSMEPPKPWEDAMVSAAHLLTPCVQAMIPYLLYRPPPAV